MYSHYSLMINIIFIVLLFNGVLTSTGKDVPFDNYYRITYGNDHVMFFNQGTELQLSMDERSGGAGFGSKVNYGSGFFQMRIKVPNKNSAGVVTTFYLSSHTGAHDEVDFEFLGNKEGKPYTLQTNVFANGVGDREQRILLWFDPTAHFHSYKILWNPHQIVFYVDNIPIRVFKNNTAMGVGYPSQPMQVLASLWDGDDWATDGGQTKTDWFSSPFIAHYQGFNVAGCSLTDNQNQNMDTKHCQSLNYWWNERKFWKLDANQKKAYQTVRNKYMNYDYCSDMDRFHVPPLECSSNTYL